MKIKVIPIKTLFLETTEYNGDKTISPLTVNYTIKVTIGSALVTDIGVLNVTEDQQVCEVASILAVDLQKHYPYEAIEVKMLQQEIV